MIIANSILGDMDWVSRARTAADLNNIQVTTTTMRPSNTSAIDVVAADFPFFGETDSAVDYTACVTVPKLN